MGQLLAEVKQLRDQEKLLSSRLRDLQESSATEIMRLNTQLNVHSLLAEATIERQLGRIKDDAFAVRVADLFDQLRKTRVTLSPKRITVHS